MINIMKIKEYSAVVKYDPDIEMFRGEFLGLNGGADFYADNVHDLKKEGEKSLKVFLEVCAEKKIKPKKEYSGKFNARVGKALHKKLVVTAAAKGMSLNDLTISLLSQIEKDNNNDNKEQR